MIQEGPDDEVFRLRQEVQQLHTALAHRPETDRVVGMIMLAASCDADTAWSTLSAVSQHTNRKARDLAALISAQVAAGQGLPADVAAVLTLVLPPTSPHLRSTTSDDRDHRNDR